jgi:hypothetical protein
MIDPRHGEQLELFPEVLEEVARQKKQETRERARQRARERREMMKRAEEKAEPPKLADVIPFRPKGVVTVTDWGGDAS